MNDERLTPTDAAAHRAAREELVRCARPGGNEFEGWSVGRLETYARNQTAALGYSERHAMMVGAELEAAEQRIAWLETDLVKVSAGLHKSETARVALLQQWEALDRLSRFQGVFLASLRRAALWVRRGF